jgi:4-azaleucine resistance transporter AzlC
MVPMNRTDLIERPTVREGVRRAAPLAVAVAAFGLSFGVLAREAGLTSVAAVVFSATTFAGSAQVAAASVLATGGTVAAAVAAAVLLNARYVPIGLSVAPALHGPAWTRALRAQLVVDESWAVSHAGQGRYEPRVLLGAGLTLYGAWVVSTALGVAGGSLLGDPERLGLDAAFPALFLALLVSQVSSRRGVAAALLGAAIAFVLIPLAPPGVPVVAAAGACLLGLRR